MDALQQTSLTPIERHQKVKTIIPAITDAVSRAKENTHQWTCSQQPPVILT